MIERNLPIQNVNFMGINTTKEDKGLVPLDKIRERIKSEIKKAGFTYGAFAALFDRTEGWISNIVNKHRGISVITLLEIAKKLNIPASALLPEEKEGNPETLDDYIDLRIDKKLDEKFEEIIKKINKIEKSLTKGN